MPSRARTRGLLALLVLNTGTRLSTDRITESLWSGSEPATARSQIQSAIYGIRRILATAGGAIEIEGGATGYRLIASEHETDLAQFEGLMSAGHAAVVEGRRDDAAALIRSALDLWDGTPLADASGSFVESAQSVLTDRHLFAVEQLADVELANGADAALVPDLAQHLAAHPMRESLRARFALTLHYAGRTNEALHNLRQYREMVVESYGLDPGARLVEVENAILRNDPRPAGERDRTAVRARIDVNGSTSSVPAQLPMAPTELIGRADEIDQLDLAVGQGGAILAITGPPCTGKTTLAVHWAHQVRDRFPDGQLYADLRGYAPGEPSSARHILRQFLRPFGVSTRSVPEDIESASALFRSVVADRRLLIVLDNVRDPQHVRPLLPGSSSCLTVVTSRDQLAGLVARDGARTVEVRPLSLHDAVRLVAGIIGWRRVEREWAATEELAELCARLPLALRIAAVRLANQARSSISAAVVRLRADPLGELAAPGDPHTAIAATFHSSYDRLSDPARRLFRLIGSAHEGVVTVDRAAQLIGADRVAADRLLTALSAANLLERHDDVRYSMHGLLRVFAADRHELCGP